MIQWLTVNNQWFVEAVSPQVVVSITAPHACIFWSHCDHQYGWHQPFSARKLLQHTSCFSGYVRIFASVTPTRPVVCLGAGTDRPSTSCLLKPQLTNQSNQVSTVKTTGTSLTRQLTRPLARPPVSADGWTHMNSFCCLWDYHRRIRNSWCWACDV